MLFRSSASVIPLAIPGMFVFVSLGSVNVYTDRRHLLMPDLPLVIAHASCFGLATPDLIGRRRTLSRRFVVTLDLIGREHTLSKMEEDAQNSRVTCPKMSCCLHTKPLYEPSCCGINRRDSMNQFAPCFVFLGRV